MNRMHVASEVSLTTGTQQIPLVLQGFWLGRTSCFRPLGRPSSCVGFFKSASPTGPSPCVAYEGHGTCWACFCASSLACESEWTSETCMWSNGLFPLARESSLHCPTVRMPMVSDPSDRKEWFFFFSIFFFFSSFWYEMFQLGNKIECSSISVSSFLHVIFQWGNIEACDISNEITNNVHHDPKISCI